MQYIVTELGQHKTWILGTDGDIFIVGYFGPSGERWWAADAESYDEMLDIHMVDLAHNGAMESYVQFGSN